MDLDSDLDLDYNQEENDNGLTSSASVLPHLRGSSYVEVLLIWLQIVIVEISVKQGWFM